MKYLMHFRIGSQIQYIYNYLKTNILTYSKWTDYILCNNFQMICPGIESTEPLFLNLKLFFPRFIYSRQATNNSSPKLHSKCWVIHFPCSTNSMQFKNIKFALNANILCDPEFTYCYISLRRRIRFFFFYRKKGFFIHILTQMVTWLPLYSCFLYKREENKKKTSWNNFSATWNAGIIER